jgi:hypothetical protein
MSELPGGEALPEGRYANFYRVGFNGYEFVIDFGQQYPPSPERIHTRIVTSPALARNLRDVLDTSLHSHEQEYGTTEDVESQHDRER